MLQILIYCNKYPSLFERRPWSRFASLQNFKVFPLGFWWKLPPIDLICTSIRFLSLISGWHGGVNFFMWNRTMMKLGMFSNVWTWKKKIKKNFKNSNFEIFFWYSASSNELIFRANMLRLGAKCLAWNADHFKKKDCWAIWSRSRDIGD